MTIKRYTCHWSGGMQENKAGEYVKYTDYLESDADRNNLQALCDKQASRIAELVEAAKQPKLTVRLQSFPESNGKRNWTALLVRTDKWDGLAGNCGGISIAHGELWNRVAYEAERAKLLIGERDTEPCILDYGDDIETPDQWAGEVHGGRPITKHEVQQ